MKRLVKEEKDGDEFAAVRRPNYCYRWGLTGKNVFNFEQLDTTLDETDYGCNLVATAKDNKGDEIYNIHISSDSPFSETIEGVSSRFEWVSGKALVYIAMDKITRRPHKVNSSPFFLLLQIIKHIYISLCMYQFKRNNK